MDDSSLASSGVYAPILVLRAGTRLAVSRWTSGGRAAVALAATVGIFKLVAGA